LVRLLSHARFLAKQRTRRMRATLDYRQGYFAGKTFGKFTTAEK